MAARRRWRRERNRGESHPTADPHIVPGTTAAGASAGVRPQVTNDGGRRSGSAGYRRESRRGLHTSTGKTRRSRARWPTQGPSNKHGNDRWQGSARESVESRKPTEGKANDGARSARATRGSRRGGIEGLREKSVKGAVAKLGKSLRRGKREPRRWVGPVVDDSGPSTQTSWNRVRGPWELGGNP